MNGRERKYEHECEYGTAAQNAGASNAADAAGDASWDTANSAVPSNITIITGISQLVTNCVEPLNANAPMTPVGQLGMIEQAAVVVRGEIIEWVGREQDLPTEYRYPCRHRAVTQFGNGSREQIEAAEANKQAEAIDEATNEATAEPRHIDLAGRALLPGFVDSHSHLVFGGDRGDEFEARMGGQQYDGGGILRTVRATRAASEDMLADRALALLREARAQGTTTMEIKSGYGLDVSNEAKLLRVAARFTPETTFLGGHAVPEEYRPVQAGDDARSGSSVPHFGDRDDYVHLVCGPMLDAVVREGNARWSDVFCEPHSPYAFDGDETCAMLTAAKQRGLGIRVHGAQLGPGPGARIACELGAASVDHCTFLTDDDLDALAATWLGKQPGAWAEMSAETSSAASSAASSKMQPAASALERQYGTVATYLPAVEFSTKQPYPDMRRAIAAGVPIAIASDCNPGTCFSDSMPFAFAIAVREMGLTIAQAVWAATAGGALALRRSDIGVIRIGAKADFALVDAPSYAHIAYRPGVPITHALDLGGHDRPPHRG
ncbi:MAG: amidohydrolase family protein [Bifidobacterium tibiigranuli]|jgi:imidazolonepropionase|uniref:amidohydrolase family protein n=1 Tax=Bifidobacterium tibiigranuli TaxID=2172043 RepID=UPI00235284C3|nr:amidohydrolase family protein [Bifidobacterium tibiigranuli]MCH3975426.1 amidohydrolase family protein [Bifidobacterium tibiigranuli]MCH4189676.1 amidohydrolase family protein [Bifidobacterium tibiigranuli]MCH4204215.1 amidohydrolase family protein [Bifidobacterium tibiigranuli]MCH4274588.1 amidohydrolase family protein [Bifidobacterium tibiigranuli]MCI1791367.1 amidohydrolase family protein [Bifidobacterium tibiigranuli]